MSRCGRAQDLLDQWKSHPVGCKETHGWIDGYDGPCTDDSWDIVHQLEMIDPMFHDVKERRLRESFAAHAPEAYAEFVAWEDTNPSSRDQPPGVPEAQRAT